MNWPNPESHTLRPMSLQPNNWVIPVASNGW